jgi:hypothetical protein
LVNGKRVSNNPHLRRPRTTRRSTGGQPGGCYRRDRGSGEKFPTVNVHIRTKLRLRDGMNHSP